MRRNTVRSLKFAVLAVLVLMLFAPLVSQAATRGSYALVSVNLASGQLTSLGCVGVRGSLAAFALKDASTGYAVGTRNALTTFPLNDPGNPTNTVTVTGLSRGEQVIGIDIRPATGELYGLTDDNRIISLDPATGVATVKGAPFSPKISGSAFGFDFNPTVDRIRVVTDRGQNLRLHPDTGQVAAIDGSLAFAANDINKRFKPRVSGAGYTNSFAGATTTTLYDIDTTRDVLVTQTPPNDGVLNTVGSLGANLSIVSGFDILPSGQAYAVVRANGLC